MCRRYSYDYFHVKISLKFLLKPFLHSAFPLITWITKLNIKKTVERRQQILFNYAHISWKTFQLLRLFFEALRIFWFICQSIFDHF